MSIGTLSEKTLHAFLKNYYEPDIDKQEIPIDKYVTDIFTGQEIMEIQTAVSAALLKKKVGTTVEVVVEGYDNKNKVFRGRSAQDAPEIDGIVYFISPEKHCIGDFVKVKIIKSSEYDLLGELAE